MQKKLIFLQIAPKIGIINSELNYYGNKIKT